MGTFLIRRLGLLLLQLLAAGTLIFVIIRLVPGDPARAVLGETATEEQIAEIHEQLGLNDPLLTQFADFWGQLLRGSLGESLVSGRPVLTDVGLRIGNTLELVLLAVGISILVGIPLGAAAARRADKARDYAITSVAVVGLSLPVFVLGTVLVLLFSVALPILPPARFVTFAEDPLGHLRLIVLPVLTLAAAPTAVVLRMTRSAMLEVLTSDFVRTARGKGIGERRVVIAHALRNSMNPVTSIIGLELAMLLGGTVIVETIFGWPGLSSLLMSGVEARDYPVVQGVVLVIAAMTIVINLAVDVAYRVIDPRIGAS